MWTLFLVKDAWQFQTYFQKAQITETEEHRVKSPVMEVFHSKPVKEWETVLFKICGTTLFPKHWALTSVWYIFSMLAFLFQNWLKKRETFLMICWSWSLVPAKKCIYSSSTPLNLTVLAFKIWSAINVCVCIYIYMHVCISFS